MAIKILFKRSKLAEIKITITFKSIFPDFQTHNKILIIFYRQKLCLSNMMTSITLTSYAKGIYYRQSKENNPQRINFSLSSLFPNVDEDTQSETARTIESIDDDILANKPMSARRIEIVDETTNTNENEQTMLDKKQDSGITNQFGLPSEAISSYKFKKYTPNPKSSKNVKQLSSKLALSSLYPDNSGNKLTEVKHETARTNHFEFMARSFFKSSYKTRTKMFPSHNVIRNIVSSVRRRLSGGLDRLSETISRISCSSKSHTKMVKLS